LVILAVLDNRAPRLQRNLIWAGLVFFGVIALSATLDGVRYFQAYANIAVATGKPNYHFALFNKSMANFPDSNRVPLWLSNELWSKPSLILITMWSSGAGMLIFLAALKGVPQALYEAAEVDGATPWQRFRSITLPMISPALFYNIVIGVIAAIQTFESVYIIQNTQTKDSLASAAFFLYERTFTQLAIGDGAAVSWVLAAVIILLTVFQFRFSKWVHYE
jgi:ABC-type sugar transport system permease subunit